MHYYDHANIDELDFDKLKAGEFAREYFVPLIKEGVEKYIANVSTKLALLVIDDQYIPLTINEKEYQNSYVASNFYAACLLEEWLTQKKIKFLGKPFVEMLKWALKCFEVNKVIFVNNWLLTSSPSIKISPEQAAQIGQFLAKKFPKHLVMWRNIDTFSYQPTIDVLKKDHHLIKTRMVFFYDPSRKKEFSSKVQYHHRRDLRLVEQNGYELFEQNELKEHDIDRLLALYQKVYMDKHTQFSPRYTKAFLEKILEKRLFSFVGVKKEGMIDGIMGFLVHQGTVTSSFFGYETSIDPSKGLYRMMTVLLLKETEKKGAVLNDGSGGAQTKKYRGLKPYLEYLAIYDRHLSLPKRALWGIMAAIMNRIVFPFSNKH